MPATNWRDVFAYVLPSDPRPSEAKVAGALYERLRAVEGPAFTHYQIAPALEWVVNHNFGHDPSGVRCVTPGGVEFTADVQYVTTNQLRVYLAAPAAGRVICIR